MPDTYTVRVALLTYKDADGHARTALRGQQVELEGSELERALSLDAVTDGEVEPAPGPVREPILPVDPQDAGALNEPGSADAPERPTDRASKASWVEFAVAQGMDRTEAESLSRDELAARHPA